LQISGEKIGVFHKNQCYDQIIAKTSISLSKKRQFFAKFFGENMLKIITPVPGHTGSNALCNSKEVGILHIHKLVA
jgi:hypothetical protein